MLTVPKAATNKVLLTEPHFLVQVASIPFKATVLKTKIKHTKIEKKQYIKNKKYKKENNKK